MARPITCICGGCETCKARAYRRRYRQTAAGQEVDRRYRQTEKAREAERRRCQRDGAKVKARTAVNNAVRDGRLVRPERCDECGMPCKPHGHHHDYSRPLDVAWLCPDCHHEAHHKEAQDAA